MTPSCWFTMRAALSEVVAVFDLDDTLYRESSYVESGLMAIASRLCEICGVELGATLLEAKRKGVVDVIGYACELAQLPASAKESLLWVYRLHEPAIRLDPGAERCLQRLRDQEAVVAILTDGRAITQRMKLRALGLGALPAYISEDYQSEKPDPLRFEAIMGRWPARRYYYVGDNPKKDFIAPNALGWKTICLRDAGNSIHPQASCECEGGEPMHWISTLEELTGLIC